VGYSDAGAFRRVFKSRLGMTPSEYVDRFRVAP
jgi:AraC-like DNA-binding protein